jgi:hypothetical protein
VDVATNEPEHEDAKECTEDDPFYNHAFLEVLLARYSNSAASNMMKTYVCVPETIVPKAIHTSVGILDAVSFRKHHLVCVYVYLFSSLLY